MVVTCIETGRFASSCGRIGSNPLDDRDGVGAGLALNIQNDCGRLIHPGGLARVLDAVYDLGDVLNENGRAVAIRDDDVLVVLWLL